MDLVADFDSMALSFIPQKCALFQLGMLVSILLAHKNGMVTSGILHITWIFFVVCGFPDYFTWWRQVDHFEVYYLFHQCSHFL